MQAIPLTLSTITGPVVAAYVGGAVVLTAFVCAMVLAARSRSHRPEGEAETAPEAGDVRDILVLLAASDATCWYCKSSPATPPSDKRVFVSAQISLGAALQPAFIDIPRCPACAGVHEQVEPSAHVDLVGALAATVGAAAGWVLSGWETGVWYAIALGFGVVIAYVLWAKDREITVCQREKTRRPDDYKGYKPYLRHTTG